MVKISAQSEHFSVLVLKVSHSKFLLFKPIFRHLDPESGSGFQIRIRIPAQIECGSNRIRIRNTGGEYDFHTDSKALVWIHIPISSSYFFFMCGGWSPKDDSYVSLLIFLGKSHFLSMTALLSNRYLQYYPRMKCRDIIFLPQSLLFKKYFCPSLPPQSIPCSLPTYSYIT